MNPFKNLFAIYSMFKTALVLILLYYLFVCIINIISLLKLKVKYTHNSEYVWCWGPIWRSSLDSNLPLFFSLMLHGAAVQTSIYFCSGD